MARFHLSLGNKPLCFTNQQPSKVATVSQIAAPQGWRGRIWVWVRRHSAGPPSSPRKRRQFRRSQPLRDGEVESESG
eukprot:7811023-Pyramimonas_sp.AAC.1